MEPTSPDSRPGRVLVTDGEFKHALGIVRALAARGHEVHLIACSDLAPASRSRAVHGLHEAPRPGSGDYDETLLRIAGALAPVSLLAVGNGTMAAADRLRGRFPADVRVALPPHESFATANDKARTAAVARSVGVAAPEERPVADAQEARAAWDELGSPMVLKSAREEGRKVLRYVRGAGELDRAFAEVQAAAGGAVLAQRYVTGEGFGFSALYWNGRRVRHFMHRRVREWPPSGGTSACAESVVESPELERAGTALLDALAWHGVAMVEFKGRPEPGGLVLMEINAKFWGSHDIALAAGVCFPCDLAALLEGRAPDAQTPYRAVRFAWPLGGDLWHGIFNPVSLPRVLWDAVWPGVAHNYRLRDPVPTMFEAWQWLRSAPGAWREFRELR